MSAKVTIEHAHQIIKKLKATLSETQSKHHKHYTAICGETAIITFGISHTKKKGKPQSHLPKQLKLTAFQTKALADCNMTFDDYCDHIRRIDQDGAQA